MANTAVKRTNNGRDDKGRFVEGNPGGGRPPMPEELKRMYQESAAEALLIAKKLMNDTDQPGQVRLRAAEYITDRGYGKPNQPTDVNVSGLSDADLIARGQASLARIGQARAADTEDASPERFN